MSQLAAVPDLDKELDRLFALQPAEFTAARNDLARRLKQTGQPEAAARVQALRKPTIAVWAVNQIGRGFGDDVAALVAAGDELRAAQEAALTGDARNRLRDATAAERVAVRTLTHRAHEILSAAGQRPNAALLDRIATTLRTAALDPRGREALAAGRLTEELESTGFQAFEGITIPRTRRAPKPPAQTTKAGAAEERRRRERLRKLRERVRKLEAQAAEAEREAEQAEAGADRARRKAERAAAAAEGARVELADAEAEAPE